MNPLETAETLSQQARLTQLISSRAHLLIHKGDLSRSATREKRYLQKSHELQMRYCLRQSSISRTREPYTTGAHLQSAAYVLDRAGATVVAGLVIARKINPDPVYYTYEVWDRQALVPFNFTDSPWWKRT